MSEQSLIFIQHKEHREWINLLSFYQDEINVFQNELGEILFDHPDLFSVWEHFEEYREIFFKKLKRIGELRKQIILHERRLAKGDNFKIEGLWDHEETKDQVSKFIEKFEALKKNFRGFIARQLQE